MVQCQLPCLQHDMGHFMGMNNLARTVVGLVAIIVYVFFDRSPRLWRVFAKIATRRGVNH